MSRFEPLSGNFPPTASLVARLLFAIYNLVKYFPMHPDSLLFFQDIQMGLLQLAIICLLLFIVGYWLGTLKSKKLMKKMAKMEKKIMDLNTELLYGPPAAGH